MKMKCKIFTVAALVTVAAAALYSQSITATKAYVDRRYADATNAVPSIVTNEVTVGFTEWRFLCEEPDIQAVISATPPKIGYNEYLGVWEATYYPEVSGYWYNLQNAVSGGEYESVVVFPAAYFRTDDDSSPPIAITATRERITRNALGLARMSDLGLLPSYEAVTNTVRDAGNSVWDELLGVAWVPRMYNGHLYYIAVTNKPPEGK